MGLNVNPYSNTPIKNLEYIQNKALVIAPFEITKSGLLDTDLMLDTPGTITMYFFRKNFNNIDKEPTAEQFKVVGSVNDISTKLGLDITASNISSSITSSYYLGFTKINVIFKYDKNTGIRTIEKDNSLLVGDYIDIGIDSTVDLTTEDYFVICNVTKNTKATNSSFTESSSMDFLFMIPSSECQEIITDFDILDANNKTINVKKYGTLGSGFVADNDTTIEPAYQADFFGDGSNIATYLFDGTCRDLTGNYNGTATGVTYGGGKVGQAVNISTTSNILIPNGGSLPFNTTNFSINFWYKPTSFANPIQSIFGTFKGGAWSTNEWLFESTHPWTGNKFSLAVYNNNPGAMTLVSNTTAVLNTLYHIVITRNNGIIDLYINGVLDKSVTINNNILFDNRSNNLPFYLGGPTSTTNCLGDLDQVRIFNRALSSNEVTALYLNNGATRVIKQESNTEKLAIDYDYATNIDYFGDGSNVANYLLRNNVNDVAGKYNGTILNSISYPSSGIIQSTSTGQVNLGNPHGNSNIVTISAWVCWNGANNMVPFTVSNYNSLYFNNGNLGFNSGNSDLYGTSSTGFDNVWKHIVVEFHTNEYGKLWIDGIPQILTRKLGTIDSSNELVANQNILIFGNAYSTGYRNFGQIKNIKIFNRSLKDSEAKLLYTGKTLSSKPDFFKDGSNIATYLFNGNCKDETGSYNGTGTGITYTKGKFGQAATFSGASDASNIALKSWDGVGDFSISLWVSKDRALASETIFGRYSSSYSAGGIFLGLITDADGSWSFTNEYNTTLYLGMNAGDDKIPLNTWTNLIVTISGSTVSLYTNGKLSAQSTSANWATGARVKSTSLLYLGQPYIPDASTAHNMFKGKIDNVRIFNRALNQREVLELYNEQPSYEEQLTLNEVTGKILTPSGNPLVVYNKDNGPSIKFDGLSYFTIPSSNDFSFGTGDFTVECLINTSSQTNQMIFDTVIAGQSGAQTGRLAIYLTATGKVEIYNGSYFTSTNSISYTQTNHIAITRTNSILKIFINGVVGYSASVATDFTLNNCTIGKDLASGGTYPLIGNISQLHIIKGVSKYSTDFTPASRLTSTTNTVLLLQVDKPVINTDKWTQIQLETVETIQAPSIVEQTGKVITNTGVTIDTTDSGSKFPNGSLSFKGLNYLTFDATNILNFGTNDFTVEFWYYTNSSTNYNIIMGIDNNNNSYPFALEVSTSRGFAFLDYSTILNYRMNPNISQWKHYAITRTNGSILTLFIDGINVATGNISANTIYNFTNMYIGKQGNYYANGFLNDFRISNISRYNTTNFTPPTSGLVKDANTIFLLQATNSNQPLTIKDPKRKDFFGDKSMVACYMLDSNANDETGFYNGSATNITYTDGKFGKCANFDGNLSLIDIPNTLTSQIKAFSANIKFNTTYLSSSYSWQFSSIICWSNTTLNFGILANGKIRFYWYDGGLRYFDGTTVLTAGVWYNISFSINNNGAVYVYLNGSLESSATFTNFVVGQFTGLRIGYDNSANKSFDGQIDNVKIFNRALTDSEVTSLYNETISPIITLETETETIASEPDFFNDKSNIATYLFDNNVNDANGKYNIIGNIEYDIGKFGQCAKFNGSTYLNLDNNNYNFSSVKSISLWFKTSDTSSTYSTILCYKGGTGYLDKAIIALNHGKLYLEGVNIVSNTLYNDNKWHHVVITNLSGSSYNWYIDGIFTATKVHTSLDVSYIGCDGATPNEYYTGQMDNLRFFNRPLTASEVQDLYKETKRVKYKAITLDDNNFGPASKFSIETQKEIKLLNYKTWTGTDATSQGYRIYPVMKIQDHTAEETSFSPKYYLGAKYQRNLSEILSQGVKSKRTIFNLKDMYLVDDLCIQTLKKINILLENNQMIKLTERLYNLTTPLKEKLNADLILEYLSTPVTGSVNSDIAATLKTSLITDYHFTQEEIDNLNDNINTFKSRARMNISTPVIQGSGLDQLRFTLPKTFVDGNRSKTEKKNLLVFGTNAGFNKFGLSGYTAPYSNVTKRDDSSVLDYNNLVLGNPVLSNYNTSIDSYTKLLLVGGVDLTGKTILSQRGMTLNTSVTKFNSSSMKFNGSGSTNEFTLTATTDFNIGLDDFTIDGWINTIDGSGHIFSIGTWRSSCCYQLSLNNGVPGLTYGNGTWSWVLSETLFSNESIPLNKWVHLVIQRKSGVCEIFINGIRNISIPWAKNLISNGEIFIGSYIGGDYGFNGYIDSFRISKGIARYQSDFVPSSIVPMNNTFKDILTNYKQQIPFTYIPLSTDAANTNNEPVFENLTDITGFNNSDIIIDVPNVL